VISNDSIPAQKYVEPPIPEAPTFSGELLKSLQQHRIVGALKHTAKRLAIARCDGTGFALAQPDLVHHRPSSSSPLRRR
jgi:hypothetical protein